MANVVIFDLQELEKKLDKKAELAAEKATETSLEWGRQQLKKVSDRAVDRWYGYYSPRSYGRTGALKDYEIVTVGDGLLVDFSQQIANHQDNDYVLGLVVAQGYHGGSYGEGVETPHWRTGFHFNKWGEPAPMSPSIIDEVNYHIRDLNEKIKQRGFQTFAKNFLG